VTTARGATVPAPHAELSEADGVLTVTFDRQDKRNAISAEMTAALWEAAGALAERDDLRVLVITNRGPYFSAGIDLGALSMDAPGTRAYAQQALRAGYAKHHALYDTFESIEKPIVLAADGHCFGAGLEMAVSCDFRLASTAATFRLPEIALGVIAGSGGSSRLTRLVGPHWGKWLAMANQQVDAERALMMGLVHDVYPAEEFHERVRAFADELIALPAEALGVAKLAVDLAADVDRTSQRHIDRLANTSLAQSEEFLRRTARFRSS
jgi:enoyl-CoA hydratase/carnithine racemase